jgi:hypothetical protein
MLKPTALVRAVVLLALVLVAVVARQQLVAQAPDESRRGPTLLRWEYKTIQANLDAEQQGKGDLNPLGQEGWELCAVVPNERPHPAILILKRSGRDSGVQRRARGQIEP